MIDADIIIVGAGPAGIAAAIPLVDAGIKVLMLDAGKADSKQSNEFNYPAMQTKNSSWKKVLGDKFQALQAVDNSSPKFRVPWIADKFSEYDQAHEFILENYVVKGMLAAGGLSNAWGAGVACFDAADLKHFPFGQSDLAASYQIIAKRIGVCGNDDDDLVDFYGRCFSLQPAPPLDAASTMLLSAYAKNPHPANSCGIYLGRSRNAVITNNLENRSGCVLCGECLQGCQNGSIYNAAYDLKYLLKQPSFNYIADVFVEELEAIANNYQVKGHSSTQAPITFTAAKVILACGAIGSAKIVLKALHLYNQSVRLLSLPALAFAMCLPKKLGAAVPEQFFSLAQLSYVIKAENLSGDYAFGNFFVSYGLPITDFIARTPLSHPIARKILKLLLPSVLVANCFLPGELSDNRLKISEDNKIHITGGFKPELVVWTKYIRKQITAVFRKYGAYILPGSFTLGLPGTDLHYAGTIPHAAVPSLGQAHSDGEVAGLPGVYVVDGAALSHLPAKAHTFTIMANADRIARIIGLKVRQ